MLQLENRLKKMRDFNLLIKHGQFVGGKFFTIKWLELAKNINYFPKKAKPRTEPTGSSTGVKLEEFKKQLKLAFVVGLKVDKRAVVRNRLKRQMREVARLLIKDGRLKDGYYVMVVAKKEAVGVEYGEITREIEGLLRRANVLKN